MAEVGVATRTVHVGLVVDKVALRQGLLGVLRSSFLRTDSFVSSVGWTMSPLTAQFHSDKASLRLNDKKLVGNNVYYVKNIKIIFYRVP
jgi:hypothetical protein